MRKFAFLTAIVAIVAFIVWWSIPNNENVPVPKQKASPEGRMEFELMRLADPATGRIPENIHMRELAFASTLPRYTAARDSVATNFTRIGPYNVGGRTRAFAIDITNTNTYLAGGVSGGMWRSEDAGLSWQRVTAPQEHAAVSCVAQDPRDGKTNIWYYGSGETVGNSASKSFSAMYRGNGIYKSTDGGKTWVSLSSTTATQHKASEWDAVFRIVVDPIRVDSDIVYAAIPKGIMRSNDGGNNWKPVLTGQQEASFTDIITTSGGVLYAALSSDANTNKGFWRSENGLEWTPITSPSFPSNHDRTVMAIPSEFENQVFFFSGTPGSGNHGNSLWKYEYISGDGSGTGGAWTDLSANLPDEDLNLYDGYCQVIGVKPDDPDVIFVGGTNLFRSTSGFTDNTHTVHVGGYRIEGDSNYHYRSGKHYPDQQTITFHPHDPMKVISTTDGGIHRTSNCTIAHVQWESLSNGYVTTQFYGIAIDHATEGSEEVIGGLQDRGTFWTNSANPQAQWSSLRGADGAYVAIEDGGEHYYSSTQYANIRRGKVNGSGVFYDDVNIMPPGMPTGSGSQLLFVHPFTLDPADNNIMYLPYGGEVWRNKDLSDTGNLETNWEKISIVSGLITSIAASESPQGVLYIGTSNKHIYKIENAHSTELTSAILISDSITNGKYTSCIAIDPTDANKLMVVYSNYSTRSLWYSEDGGVTWSDVEGNLKGTTDQNVPPAFDYIGDGPSIRWAEIIPLDSGYIYYIGTSIGLFSTRELKGANTIWVQEGANTIGNVVVDMLDYRPIDKWLVVGTHGNGIYAAHLNILKDTVDTATGSIVLPSDAFRVKAYPNPASETMTIEYSLQMDAEVVISVFDQQGRTVKTLGHQKAGKGKNTATLELKGLPAGPYYYNVRSKEFNISKPFIKR